MKFKTLFLSLMLVCVSLSALNFDVLGAAVANPAQIGNLVSDTVSYADGAAFDSFSYLNEFACGTNEALVKITNPALGNNGSEAGLMIRESLLAGSPYLAVFVSGNRYLQIEERQTTGGLSVTRLVKISRKAAGFWLKIIKTGQLNTIAVKYSNSGSWEVLDNGVYMPGGCYHVGIMSAGGPGSDATVFEYKHFAVNPIPARLAGQVSYPIAYPNPATHTLSVNVPADLARCFSVEGKEVQMEQLSESSFDVSDLAPGSYYLRTNSGIVVRFVKIE